MKMLRFGLCFIITSLLSGVIAFAQKDQVSANYDQIVHNVAKMVEVLHFNETSFNDEFSKKLFIAGYEDLDPEKMLFLEEDQDALKQFSTVLDDELRGGKVEFFKRLSGIYTIRVNEAGELINEILRRPVNLLSKDTFVMERRFASFPKSLEEKKQLWRKYLTYQVLNIYVDPADSLIMAGSLSIDTVKERKAREVVQGIQKRNLERMQLVSAEEEQFSRYLNSMIHLMDPHSNYFLPVDRRGFQEDMSGIYYGIGALLQDQNGKISIGELMIGGPAWRSGEVEKGDVIVAIRQDEGITQQVEGMAMPEVIKLTRGKKNTTVTITFRNIAGKIKEVTLNREALQLEDTFAKSAVLGDSSKIGYIYLPKFYTSFDDSSGRSSATDIAREIKKLQAESVKGLIIDVRDNGGGSLEEVIQMVGLFVGDGPVVQVKSREQSPMVAKVENVAKVYDGPLLVLVNERSASASEIFAAAIQDYKRGVILGSPSTFGKGTVQRGFRVPGKDFKLQEDLGSLHLTWQKYYRVNGDATQLKGIIPDITLPGLYTHMKMQEKDYPNALPWDGIQPAKYAVKSSAAYLPFIKQQSEKRQDTTDAFKILARNLEELTDTEGYYPLHINDFRDQRIMIRKTYDSIRFNSFRSLNVSVQNPKTDAEALSKREQFRKDNNNAWLSRLKRDLYLGEALDIMNDLIGN